MAKKNDAKKKGNDDEDRKKDKKYSKDDCKKDKKAKTRGCDLLDLLDKKVSVGETTQLSWRDHSVLPPTL